MLRLTSAGLAEPSTQRKSRRANSSFQPAPSSQRLTSATPRRLTSSGAIECSKEQVAALASSSSVMCSSARHASYSSSSRGPKSSGSSELIVTGTPARSSAGSGCSSSDGTDRSSTFELGHTSRQIASRASLCTRGLSQKHSTPCATRRAPKSSTADRTESAPDTPPPGASSPACGNAASPAAAAIRNASAKGAGGLPGSAECRPKPTMPARPWTRCWPRETTPPTTVASRSALAAGSCLSAEKMYAHAWGGRAGGEVEPVLVRLDRGQRAAPRPHSQPHLGWTSAGTSAGSQLDLGWTSAGSLGWISAHHSAAEGVLGRRRRLEQQQHRRLEAVEAVAPQLQARRNLNPAAAGGERVLKEFTHDAEDVVAVAEALARCAVRTGKGVEI
mmetsp:Transcript_19508/g.64506  ORF Transcript_19508/g.64506 Transcript_19508/m.64506 type:complete len:389 (+) Transcript_19508:86-1252(+)